MVDPYGRTLRRSGVTLNWRTVEMLEITELRELRNLAPIALSQGSYTTGVSQSAGTHAGGGVFDVKVSTIVRSEWWHVVGALRRTGFAAWLRDPSQGDWPYHIHAVAIGDRELSDAAAWQVSEYKAGRNGLANRGLDTGPRVAWTEYRQDIDLSYYGPERYDDKDFDRLERRVGWKRDVPNLNTPEGDTIDAMTALTYAHQHATDADTQSAAALVEAKAAHAAAEEAVKWAQAIAAKVGVSEPAPF